jgi:peptidyl-tRNA hydrolase, PTH1 family
MKIIVGLGNPGEKYEGTRHNVGFYFLDQISSHNKLNSVGESLVFSKNNKLKSEIAETRVAGERVILVKPQTFVNLSGEAMVAVSNFYKALPSDVLVVCDDLNLRLGVTRLRLSGSSGGHNGLKSVINSLGTEDFKRFRIGIAQNKVGEQESEKIYESLQAKKFVLEKFTKRELPVIKKMVGKVAELIIEFIGQKEEIKARTFTA